ncbi:unnamed protein product, partial [Prorocentrum cordatum]
MRSEYTNEWVTHIAGKWDASVAGNSTLKEALVRSFADEVLEWAPMQVYTVTALWDAAEFYDTLEPALILEERLRLGIPARTLHLEMLSHLSTRLIRERSAYAEPIATDRSICAGARRGIDFGRVALYAVLEKVSTKYEQVYVRSWVHDVTTRMKGSRREVVRQLANAGVDFAAGVKKARLTMSTKSALIGNDMDVAKEVALKLHSRNITAKVKSQVEIAKGDPAFGAAFALLRRAMVNTLLNLAWDPKGPRHWVSDAGEEFGGGSDPTGLDSDVDISDRKQAPSDAIERRQWSAAANHYAGKGLEDGADLRSARALIRKFKAKGDYDKVGAQLALFIGAVWPRQRVADLGIEVSMHPSEDGQGPSEWLLAAGGASGGEHTADPRLRRIARGWVILQTTELNKPMFVAGARGALAGWRQSVNRGELTALKELLAAASGYQKIRYTADSAYVMRGVRELIKGKELDLVKTESHISAKDAVDAGVDPIDFIGNVLADDFVDGIIERVQVPRAQARTLGFAEGIAALVRSRGLATLQAAIEVEPSAGPSQKERREANIQKRRREKLLAETKHVITYDVDGKHYGCSRCGGRVPILKAAAWLAEECMPVERSKASMHGATSSKAQIGHQKIHASHHSVYHDELCLHYCKRCGCIARESMRDL